MERRRRPPAGPAQARRPEPARRGGRGRPHPPAHGHLREREAGQIPTGIGIYGDQFLTELHTHDATGLLHVESPKKQTFDLGQFFAAWGVRLDKDCIGGYCKPDTPWRIYVDGAEYTGDPGELQLKKHQEIAIVIGTPPRTSPRASASRPGLKSAQAGAILGPPGWRNWSYAPDLKSGVPVGGVRVRLPPPACAVARAELDSERGRGAGGFARTRAPGVGDAALPYGDGADRAGASVRGREARRRAAAVPRARGHGLDPGQARQRAEDRVPGYRVQHSTVSARPRAACATTPT